MPDRLQYRHQNGSALRYVAVFLLMRKGARQTEEKWEDNIRKWTGLVFARFQRAVENRKKWRKLVAKIICGALTTPVVKG